MLPQNFENSGKVSEKETSFSYRQAVGSLIYLMLGSRPDLAYSVGFLSKTLQNLSVKDVARLKRVFCYIARTIDLKIVYSSNEENGILECYIDADFGRCSKIGHST